MPVAHFSRIVIIQSLGSKDGFTGTRLHEDLEVLEAYYDLGLEVELINIESRAELFETLRIVERRALEDSAYPLLHFEIHGSDDATGLILSSGQYVPWEELKEPLTNINIASRLNLIVILAVCHGAHLMKIIQPVDRAPCWALIGPTKEIDNGLILSGFYKFYKTLLETGSGGKAFCDLIEMAESMGHEEVYHFTNAEELFKTVYVRYIKEECTPESVFIRAKRMYRKLKKEESVKVPSIGRLKRQLKRTQQHYFEKYSNNFFMYDLYSENKTRFNVEYKVVVGQESL